MMMESPAQDLSEESTVVRRRGPVDLGGFRELWGRQPGQARASAVRGLTTAALVAWALALFVIYLTWNGAAEQTRLVLQVPYLISGGFTVAVLTAIGGVLFLAGALHRLAADDDAGPDSADGTGRS